MNKIGKRWIYRIRYTLWKILGTRYFIFLKNQNVVFLDDFKEAKIGKYTYNNGATVWRWGKKSELEIGNYCSIAHQVQFILDAGHHDLFKLSNYPFIHQFFEQDEKVWYQGRFVTRNDLIQDYPWAKKGIKIGHDVWIGANSVILPDVTIGNGCTILAGAVITKSFEDFSIIAGIPAKKIGDKIPKEYQKEFSEIEWWNWDKEKIKNSIADFNLEVGDFLKKYRPKV